MSNPGSRSASSGNSRKSDRQNASIVLIATSPSRSRTAFQWARSNSDWLAPAFRLRRIRSPLPAAALRVNVIARMLAGSTPAFRRLMYRQTRTDVLPVPADASSTTFCAGSTANCRACASGSAAGATIATAARSGSIAPNSGSCDVGSREIDLVIADVVLATDARVRAPRTEERLVGAGREIAALDPVDGSQQPLLSGS